MSKDINTLLHKSPLILRYAKSGLVNLMALARRFKDQGLEGSIEAIGMELRRHIQKSDLPTIEMFDFSPYDLQIMSRTGIREIIIRKTPENRRKCWELIHHIAESEYFLSLTEGEKEMVIMTDLDNAKLLENTDLQPLVEHKTDGLGFLSIDFPITMRDIPGIYSIITSAFSGENISIHAFHTIGGEIIVLFEQEDLIKAQKILQSLFVG